MSKINDLKMAICSKRQRIFFNAVDYTGHFYALFAKAPHKYNITVIKNIAHDISAVKQLCREHLWGAFIQNVRLP